MLSQCTVICCHIVKTDDKPSEEENTINGRLRSLKKTGGHTPFKNAAAVTTSGDARPKLRYVRIWLNL